MDHNESSIYLLYYLEYWIFLDILKVIEKGLHSLCVLITYMTSVCIYVYERITFQLILNILDFVKKWFNICWVCGIVSGLFSWFCLDITQTHVLYWFRLWKYICAVNYWQIFIMAPRYQFYIYLDKNIVLCFKYLPGFPCTIIKE